MRNPIDVARGITAEKPVAGVAHVQAEHEFGPGREPTEIERGAAYITVLVEQSHVGRIAIEEQGVEITGIAAQEGRRYVPRIGNQQAAPNDRHVQQRSRGCRSDQAERHCDNDEHDQQRTIGRAAGVLNGKGVVSWHEEYSGLG